MGGEGERDRRQPENLVPLCKTSLSLIIFDSPSRNSLTVLGNSQLRIDNKYLKKNNHRFVTTGFHEKKCFVLFISLTSVAAYFSLRAREQCHSVKHH